MTINLNNNNILNSHININSSINPIIGNSSFSLEWTPRLKKLRQITKKRDNDSKIYIGP